MEAMMIKRQCQGSGHIAHISGEQVQTQTRILMTRMMRDMKAVSLSKPLSYIFIDPDEEEKVPQESEKSTESKQSPLTKEALESVEAGGDQSKH